MRKEEMKKLMSRLEAFADKHEDKIDKILDALNSEATEDYRTIFNELVGSLIHGWSLRRDILRSQDAVTRLLAGERITRKDAKALLGVLSGAGYFAGKTVEQGRSSLHRMDQAQAHHKERGQTKRQQRVKDLGAQVAAATARARTAAQSKPGGAFFDEAAQPRFEECGKGGK